MRKGYFVLVIFVVIFLVGYSYSIQSKEIPDEMDVAITEFIINHNKTRFGETEKQFEVHKIYGTEEKDGIIHVYMYSLYNGYNRTTGAYPRSGGSYPVYLSLKKEENDYTILEYMEPDDGYYHVTSIKEMFPRKYVNKAIRDSGNISGLEKEMTKQVEEWLGKKEER
ncbi:hypothetical protein [Sutcliffiella halmapala]|uniref:hypothetical protein n=1 Tax=Sutcliffiella halmapala TaxID=79882 RepID=UPI000994DBE4|nr:hypothetical protein [Sutcliffiella halmapala]